MVSVMAKQLIPAGYKQTEVGVIPEDWRVETLSNVCEKITDGTHDTPKPTTLGVPFLTAIHVKENRIDFESCYYLPKSIHDEIYRRCNPKKNDVLMVNIGAGVATSALVNVDYEFSLKNVALLKPSKLKIIGAYLNSYQSYVKNKVYESLATGGAQPFLSLFQIGQLKISLPSVQEQTAIANALSDVDALIVALEKLINKKSAIKTAAMQQLLTGKKRLPPFDQTNTGYKQTELGEIPGDWDILTLSNVVKSTQLGGNYGNSEKETNFPLIKMGNLDRGTIKLDKLEFITRIPNELDLLKYGDVLFNTRNTLELVGKVAIWRNELPKAYFNSNLMRFDFNEELVASSFYLNATLNTKQFITSLSGIATGTTSVAAIYTKDLLNLKIVLPKKDEQIAIANALSDMDKDLEVLQQRLHKTQQIKQGMMQELLTGKTRLISGISEP